MAFNFGAITQPITEAILRAYLLKFERDWAQQQGIQAQERDYADWVRRQQFMQQLEAPERQRLETERERQRAEQETARKRAEAQARINSFWRQFPLAEIVKNPDFLRDYELAAGVSYPTQKVPETVGIGGPRPEEGGLSRFLSPRGTVQIPTGRTLEQPLVPQQAPQMTVEIAPGIRVPLDEASKIVGTEGVRTLLGIQQPARVEDSTQRRQRVATEVRQLFERIQAAQNPEEARAAAVAFNNRIAEARKFGISLPFQPVTVAQVVADVRARQKRTGAGGEGGVGAPIGGTVATGEVRLPSGATVVEVRPVRNKQGVVAHYAVRMSNGLLVQMTPDQARAESERLIAVGDPRARSLAFKTGMTQARWNSLKRGATGEAARQAQLQTEVRQAETDLRKLQEDHAAEVAVWRQVMQTFGRKSQQAADQNLKIRGIVARMQRVQARIDSLRARLRGQGGVGTTAPPPAGQETDPLGLR